MSHSAADEVEHVAPKNLFPGRAFDWMNYVYACGPCNGPKRSRFSYIKFGYRHNFERRKGDPVVPPPQGIDASIDPRSEDTADFLTLDLAGTFWFVPTASDPVGQLRAPWTIELLNLNRPVLTRARKAAFHMYEDRLAQYAHRKAAGDPQAELDRRKARIIRGHHFSVFVEMQRSPRTAVLFTDIPEALHWKP